MYEAVISGDGLTLRLQVEDYERHDALAEDATRLGVTARSLGDPVRRFPPPP